MHVIEHELYVNRVNRTIEKLRAMCLGQDADLMAGLPTHLLAESAERRAAHLARQLLFALAAVDQDGTRELYQKSWEWMYGAILYLLRECNREDQTFQEMVRLIKLPQGVRALIFDKEGAPEGNDYTALRVDMEPPRPLEALDVAILCLMKAQGQRERVQQTYQAVVVLLQDAGS